MNVVFVSDFFDDELLGGAELTSRALLNSAPCAVSTIKSSNVDLKYVEDHQDDFWIFGNWSMMNVELIPTIIANLNYAVIEFDYKFCKFRSTEKHFAAVNMPCSCHNEDHGKIVSAFYHAAKCLWWMSEKQMEKYHILFPFLQENVNVVLSSVFSDETLAKIKLLNEIRDKNSAVKQGWLVQNSQSWIKGSKVAIEWCRSKNIEPTLLANTSYDETLAMLSDAEGFVFLPQGGDTCPRIVIEAKLLGCKLILNDNVQHKDEEWFNTDDVEKIYEYLYANKQLFWNGIAEAASRRPTISGYTTTYNCINQQYPFVECIKSMLQFCDEICVVDGGSTDGTWESLRKLQVDTAPSASRLLMFDCDASALEHFNSVSFLKLKQVTRDWADTRFAVFDGLQKAEARKMCTKEFCWQMDSDEIVHEDDVQKIWHLAGKFPADVDVLSLPVIEYWGSSGKVRADINPAKWRLSRNKPNITHGIPLSLRDVDAEGKIFAKHGTDGCDMIDASTFEIIPSISFMSKEMHELKYACTHLGDTSPWQSMFSKIIAALPCVHHYSWWNIERKIKLYRDTWTKHWASLYNEPAVNCFFENVEWEDVTDEMIVELAKKLEEKTGGWIFHTPWRGELINHITVERTHPKAISERLPGDK